MSRGVDLRRLPFWYGGSSSTSVIHSGKVSRRLMEKSPEPTKIKMIVFHSINMGIHGTPEV